MSYLSKAKHIVMGAKHELVEGAEYAAAMGAFGYVQQRYRAGVMGAPADLVAGALAKVAAIGLDYYGKGRKFHPYLDLVGNAGLGSYFHTVGAAMGAQNSGMKRIMVKDSDLGKVKKAVPDATILGAIPKATKVNFMSAAELAALAR